jgi:hypothetical protein
MTPEQFLSANPIRFGAARVASNPHMVDFEGDHYRCTISRPDKRRMTVFYSKGHGHNGVPPTALEVINCLADDAAMIENARDFNDFCAELGYDTDSRQAERTYKACQQQTDRLKSLFGHAYHDLLYGTERD